MLGVGPKLKSQAIKYRDFNSQWYSRWSKELKQTAKYVDNPIHNKYWQNAAIAQAIFERGYLKPGNKAIGFGVGNERIPSLLAKYGVKVTATDQNPNKVAAKGWDNGQLAKDLKSLNSRGICSDAQFNKNVRYKQNDMNAVNADFTDSFDIVWSNCSLGHLGSIENGIDFIRNSLLCLKDEGIAVHTTEINVLSNRSTLDSGDTVIFRETDIETLFKELRSKGYECGQLVLDFGSTDLDKHISFEPFPRSNLLKLQVMGHILSQIILIIRKPPARRVRRPLLLTKFYSLKERTTNYYRKKIFLQKNKTLRTYLSFQAQNTILPKDVTPKNKKVRVKGKVNDHISVSLEFYNGSNQTFFGLHHAMQGVPPILLSTDNPINRISKFYSEEWFSKNRVSADFSKVSGSSKILNGLLAFAPTSTCAFDVKLKLPPTIGVYKEHFCLNLEGVGKIPDSGVEIAVDIS